MLVCSFTTFANIEIEIDGRVFAFEWSDRFGPALVDKRGDILQDGRAVPPKQSPFWRALRWWIVQGKRLDGRRCVYEPVTRTVEWIQVGRDCFPNTPEYRAKLTALGAPLPLEIITDVQDVF